MPLHPRFVHFPIALLITGVALTLYALYRRQRRWEESAHLLIVLGWLALLPAAASGLIGLGALAVADPRRAVANVHITYFFATWIAFGVALYLRLKAPAILYLPRQRWYYLAALAIGTLFVFLTGHTGGRLVYELGVGVNLP